MNSEFEITLQISEQYIITTGSSVTFRFLNHIWRCISLMWCATIISSAVAGATLLEVQEAVVEDEDESAAPSDALVKKNHISLVILQDYFSVKDHHE